MKKLLLPALSLSLLIACGDGETKTAEETPAAETQQSEEVVVPEPVDVTKTPAYTDGLALVAQSDCLTCHKISEPLVGPAYSEVAARYQNAADTTVQRLAKKIIAGGAGEWGPSPMSPHPNLSQEDAEKMVRYVLLLKK